MNDKVAEEPKETPGGGAATAREEEMKWENQPKYSPIFKGPTKFYKKQTNWNWSFQEVFEPDHDQA